VKEPAARRAQKHSAKREQRGSLDQPAHDLECRAERHERIRHRSHETGKRFARKDPTIVSRTVTAKTPAMKYVTT